MPRTVIIHPAVFVQGGQVEAFPEAVAVPYLNRDNIQQLPVKMLSHPPERVSPPAAGFHPFPWRRLWGLGQERAHWVTWGAEVKPKVTFDAGWESQVGSE